MTWRAIEALLVATGNGDYDTMARALVTIGATSEEVDIKVRACAWGRGSRTPHCTHFVCTTSQDGC